MANPAKFNFPEDDDKLFGKKVVDLLRQLFDNQDSDVKNFRAISEPESKQLGDIWFDSSDSKLKVNTPEGVKILKYE